MTLRVGISFSVIHIGGFLVIQ